MLARTLVLAALSLSTVTLAVACDVTDRDHDVTDRNGAADVELTPCGNGIVEAGELCDDGLLNGPHRECTQYCTFNDCNLDYYGNCEAPHPGVADVPYHPCGNGVLDEGEACDDGVLNGPSRRCTNACEFNDCEVADDGWCESPIGPNDLSAEVEGGGE
jgi:hypothetical protein